MVVRSFLSLVCLLISLLMVSAGEITDAPTTVIDHGPVGQLKKVRFHVSNLASDRKGVLIIAENVGESILRTSKDAKWRGFVEKNGLVLCVIEFHSVTGEEVSAITEIPQLLDATLEHLGLLDQSTLLFGRHYGGSLVSSLASSGSRRISAWATIGALDWPDSARASTFPPGLAICGELEMSGYEGGEAFVKRMRKDGAPVAWLSLRQFRGDWHPPSENLTRDFFQSILTPPSKSSPVLATNCPAPDGMSELTS